MAQDPATIELILIDDGSSDDGFLAAQRWKEEHGSRFARIDFQRQTNAGITKTFDRLLKKSTGSALMIVASDDMLLPGSIAKRKELLLQPGVLAVFGDAIPIDEEGNVTGTSAVAELGRPCSRAALADARTLPWEIIYRWNIYGSVLLCRREAMIKPDGNSVLNLDLYSEDMQLYYLFASKGGLRYINEPVAKYRVHTGSASHSPSNLAILRTNIYCSRKHAMPAMPIWRRAVVGMQAITYHRWNTSLRSRLLLPVVAVAYAGLLTSRFAYDFYRTKMLGQPREI
ncbi:glycosyltransferase involved in cell wall biosynthesis [Duganella sp. 3397]|nr:glycosyltransferase involved in cell wall biosynthesis [Duganella sp. 3397]